MGPSGHSNGTSPRTRPSEPGQADEPELDMLETAGDLLSPLERFQIRFVRRTLQHGRLDSTLRWFQRTIGQGWINHSIRNLLHVHGLERLPELDVRESYVLVSNHRSFFDLYVVTAYLVARGLPHRILFPVRSNFFYDHPLGMVVNGAMSFFAMYPPVFRDRKRQALNLAGIDEVARLLRVGGAFVGLHPEGTRNKDGDPYQLLPAQAGVGRIIHKARVTVLPVFIHGLVNSIPEQVVTNATKRGEPVHMVFGAPVDFGRLLDAPGSGRTFRRISELAREAIVALGDEERAHRAASAR